MERDNWELEEDSARKTRRGGFEALLVLHDDKDRSIKEQARVLVVPVQELEQVILHLRDLPRGEGEEAVKMDKTMESLRSVRATLVQRLEVLQVAKEFGWAGVDTHFGKLDSGIRPELRTAVEKSIRKSGGVVGNRHYHSVKRRASSYPPRRGNWDQWGGPYSQPPPAMGHQQQHQHQQPPPPPDQQWQQPGTSYGYKQPRRAPSAPPASAPRSSGPCFTCGVEGHYSKACPKK